MIEKMDKFSNKQLSEDEKIDFLQEIVDNGMVWKMHRKYVESAEFYMNQGLVVDMVLYRKQPSDLEERYQASRLAGEC